MPIHTVSGKPQCQRPFVARDGNTYHCTRPEGHDTALHATAQHTEAS